MKNLSTVLRSKTIRLKKTSHMMMKRDKQVVEWFPVPFSMVLNSVVHLLDKLPTKIIRALSASCDFNLAGRKNEFMFFSRVYMSIRASSRH